jgi:hypothetical protein
MTSTPQDNPVGEGYAGQDTSVAAGTAHLSVSLGTHYKRKKRRRASSGAVQGNLLNTHSPKRAPAIRRAKGKGAQNAHSRDVNSAAPEDIFDKSSQEGRDHKFDPCMFTAGPV